MSSAVTFVKKIQPPHEFTNVNKSRMKKMIYGNGALFLLHYITTYKAHE
jgi:hypothetical protein